MENQTKEASDVSCPAPNAKVVALADTFVRPGRAIDVGAGNLRNARWLANHRWAVSVIDVSNSVVAEAKSLGLFDYVVRGSIAEQPLRIPQWKFDFVVCTMVVHFLADYIELRSALQNLARLTAPGGVLYLTCLSDTNRQGLRPLQPTISDLISPFDGWSLETVDIRLTEPTVLVMGDPPRRAHAIRLTLVGP